VTLGYHWSLRPQIASYVCFALELALLSFAFRGWEGKWQLSWPRAADSVDGACGEISPANLEYSSQRLRLLWLAAPLFVIWTNSHGGFLAGLCIFGAYLGLRGIEAIWRKGRAADGLVARFGLMGLAAVGATVLNPYGLNFHRWLFDDLKVPRPEIVEWRAPELFDPQFLPFWLLLIAAVAAIALSRRERDFTQITILALVLWQALTHHRHIAFFALACGWWLPMHWDSLLQSFGIGTRAKPDEKECLASTAPPSEVYAAAFPPRMQQAAAVLLGLAICLCSVQLAQRVTNLKVDKSAYPVAAFDYVARRGLTGKMVCTFNWAQYALSAFGPHDAGEPGILVQIDGRCRTSYSQEMLDTHFDFLIGNVAADQRYRDPKSGPFDPTRVLNAGRPDLVLISRLQLPSVEVMQAQPRSAWVLLYQDSLAQLWGRANRYDDPNSIYFVSPQHREIGNSAQLGSARWPALPNYSREIVLGDDANKTLAGAGPTTAEL
jgi:hypothetical protein